MSDDTCPWCNGPLIGEVFEDRWGNVFCSRDCRRSYVTDMLGLDADREFDDEEFDDDDD